MYRIAGTVSHNILVVVNDLPITLYFRLHMSQSIEEEVFNSSSLHDQITIEKKVTTLVSVDNTQ